MSLAGSMDESRAPDPTPYERANYIQLLQSRARSGHHRG